MFYIDISLILHGPLQGRIAGIAMALRINSKDSSLSNLERESKLKEIQNLLESVIDDVRERFDVEEDANFESIIVKLIEIRRSWSGIAEIDWNIDPDAFLYVERLEAKTLRNILYEAVSNSVRHGEADLVAISFSVKDDKLLIKIKDNGHGVSPDFVASVGLKSITMAGGDYFFTPDLELGAELNIVF